MSDNIKKRIAALLAKAEGTDNEFEAATFMAKVNELLEKHQIEMHEIRAASGDNDPMGKERGEANIYASMSWSLDVASALSKYYGCRFVYWKRGNHFLYEIVGRESARTTFELMFPFVLSQVKQVSKPLALHLGSASKASRQVAQALCIRVWKLAKEAETHREVLVGKGLIPVSDLDAAMADFFPELKKAKNKQFSYGQTAKDLADKVSINVQATGKHVKLIGEK